MLALLALCLGGLAVASRSGRDDEGVVREDLFVLHVGGRALADDDFWPVDRVHVVGFEYVRSFQRESAAGLGLELGVFSAVDEDEVAGVEVADGFLEASIGLRGRMNAGPTSSTPAPVPT